MVDVPRLHFRFYVSYPYDHGGRIRIKGPFEDGSRSSELFLIKLEVGITKPIVQVQSVPLDVGFVLCPLPALVFVKLLEVSEACCRGRQR